MKRKARHHPDWMRTWTSVPARLTARSSPPTRTSPSTLRRSGRRTRVRSKAQLIRGSRSVSLLANSRTPDAGPIARLLLRHGFAELRGADLSARAIEHKHQRRRAQRQDASFPAGAEARDRLLLAVAGAASERPEARKRNVDRAGNHCCSGRHAEAHRGPPVVRLYIGTRRIGTSAEPSGPKLRNAREASARDGAGAALTRRGLPTSAIRWRRASGADGVKSSKRSSA